MKEHMLRESISDRYYEWLSWKGTRHEKECLANLKNSIHKLQETHEN